MHRVQTDAVTLFQHLATMHLKPPPQTLICVFFFLVLFTISFFLVLFTISFLACWWRGLGMAMLVKHFGTD